MLIIVKKKEKKKAQEAVIFVSVSLHSLTKQCIHTSLKISLKYFTDGNI